MGAPISVVAIYLQLEIAAPIKVPPEATDCPLCSVTDNTQMFDKIIIFKKNQSNKNK